jgi:hypothetical protein
MRALRLVAVAILALELSPRTSAAEGVGVAPAFAIRGYGLRDADASGATVAFDAELANPSLGAVSLERVAFALEVGGKRVVEGTVPREVEVPPGGAVVISFPERIRYADLPALALKTAIHGRVPLRLVAIAVVRTSLAVLELPVAWDGELSIPKTPGVGLAGFRVISMNPFDAAVEVKVALENENAFPLPPGTLRYRVTVAGGDLSASEAVLPPIAPGGKATVAIPLKVSLRRAGTAVVKALQGDAAVVGLHALASVGPLEWPVDLEARLPTRP